MSTGQNGRRFRVLALLALVAAVGLGVVIERTSATVGEARKEVNPTAVRQAQELSEAFHNAAEVAMPSVVTIRSRSKAQPVAKSGPRTPGGPRGENPFKGTPFEDFFNERGGEGGMAIPQPRREGMGSGVIIDSSGIVLTNNHVVEGADEVVVHLADGREFKADEIKTDEQTDLAVIRIKGAGQLPAARLGDSDKLRIGDWVMAIGSPFELDQTVSAGIISGVGRELSSIRRAKFLQTDAAINPGNSGGPLINLHGEVIGINTAIATNSGSFNGIGFAIPSNLATWVTGHLIKQGSVQRAYLGVELNEMSPDLAERFGVRYGEGVLISQVFPNTPAEAAGFKRRDVITKFAGQKVKDRGELQALVERVDVDKPQEVEVLREGKTETLHVTPKAMPKQFGSVDLKRSPERGSAADPSSYNAEELGVEVADLTADRAEALGYEADGGVLITKVDADKVAYEKGLRAGMLVLDVGKSSVKNVEEFKTALKGQSLKEGIDLLVRVPNGGNRFVLLKD
jgi:serine protease Do